MNVGSEADDGKYYFANAHKLNKITIWSDVKGDAVDITDDAVTDITNKKLLNIVGKFMFANCWALSTKYINRLIKGVTEIKDNAFSQMTIIVKIYLTKQTIQLLRYPAQ